MVTICKPLIFCVVQLSFKHPGYVVELKVELVREKSDMSGNFEPDQMWQPWITLKRDITRIKGGITKLSYIKWKP